MRNVIMIVAVLLLLVGSGVSYKTRSLQYVYPKLASAGQENAKSYFGIEGRVINADGDLIAGAKVFAESDNGGLSHILSGVSDKEGNFKIILNEQGNYTVFGSKEEDGYPLTVSGFHQQVSLDQIPKLSITERKTVTNIVLQLGKKAAIIEGTIKDALTNQAIRRATITLRRADNPDLFYRTSTDGMHPGKFKIVVPTVAFRFETESPGYEAWTYGNNGLQGSIRLARGETRRLEVALRKSVDQ
jgi:hypothetical protein